MLDGPWTVDPGGMTRTAIRLLSALALAGLAVALPAATASAAAPCANADLVPTASNLAAVRAATLCLLNVERTSRGLVALRADGQLRKVAQRYTGQMVTHRFFAHVGHDGSTLSSRVVSSTKYVARAASWSLGENLYWGSGRLATPQQSVEGWMNSPGHRRNVLNSRFRDIGIGITIGAPEDVSGSSAATYATEFGTRSFR
jgi:uncharacterized protein YkwD